MSSTLNPFGLRPAFHGGGGMIRPSQYTIVSGYTSNILQNQPIKIDSDGYIAAASINDRFIGTFQGVEWTDSDGMPRYSNKWTANTAGTNIVCYTTEDPMITYEIQADASLTLADMGEQFDYTTITAGSTTTGLSAIALDVSTSAANAALRLMNIAPYPGNDWGDAYPIVQVQIAEHQFVADVAAF